MKSKALENTFFPSKDPFPGNKLVTISQLSYCGCGPGAGAGMSSGLGAWRTEFWSSVNILRDLPRSEALFLSAK